MSGYLTGVAIGTMVGVSAWETFGRVAYLIAAAAAALAAIVAWREVRRERSVATHPAHERARADQLLRDGFEAMQREWDKGPSTEPARYVMPPSYVKRVRARADQEED